MLKSKSCVKPLEPIQEEMAVTPGIRSIQHFGDLGEVPSRDSYTSSHRSAIYVDQISSSSGTNSGDIVESDPFFCLSRFESSLFATILEDMMLAFRILGECNNSLRVERVVDDTPLHLYKKYSIRRAANQPTELDLIDPQRLGCKEYKMHKLETDRNNIKNAIQSAYTGLSLSRSFRPLWNVCQDIVDRQEYVESTIETHMENKTLARSLHRQLRQQRVQQRSAKYETDTSIDEFRKEIQDAELMASITERYTMKWQTARTEQHQEDLETKRAVFSESIHYHKLRSEQESVVHNEIEILMNVYIQETLQKIEDIMTKYETDMEEMDLKIQIMMSDVNRITFENKGMEDLYKGRDKEMKAWVKFKKERARAQKYHDDMTRCAVTVQAWWRGLLVRKQIGPFRVRGRPKPPAKKK